MEFFGKNLKFRHKVTLCLVALCILGNYVICTSLPGTFPYVEYIGNGHYRLEASQIILSFGIFVKMLVIAFFRKF